MTQFTSTRLHNTDPTPWRMEGDMWRAPHPYYRDSHFNEWDPRPEYDDSNRPQPNPLLQDFRIDPFFPDVIDRARNYLEVNLSDMSLEATAWECTPDQIEHARRVLTRLINLATPEGAR